jgi:hypothetical protein
VLHGGSAAGVVRFRRFRPGGVEYSSFCSRRTDRRAKGREQCSGSLGSEARVLCRLPGTRRTPRTAQPPDGPRDRTLGERKRPGARWQCPRLRAAAVPDFPAHSEGERAVSGLLGRQHLPGTALIRPPPGGRPVMHAGPSSLAHARAQATARARERSPIAQKQHRRSLERVPPRVVAPRDGQPKAERNAAG